MKIKFTIKEATYNKEILDLYRFLVKALETLWSYDLTFGKEIESVTPEIRKRFLKFNPPIKIFSMDDMIRQLIRNFKYDDLISMSFKYPIGNKLVDIDFKLNITYNVNKKSYVFEYDGSYVNVDTFFDDYEKFIKDEASDQFKINGEIRVGNTPVLPEIRKSYGQLKEIVAHEIEHFNQNEKSLKKNPNFKRRKLRSDSKYGYYHSNHEAEAFVVGLVKYAKYFKKPFEEIFIKFCKNQLVPLLYSNKVDSNAQQDLLNAIMGRPITKIDMKTVLRPAQLRKIITKMINYYNKRYFKNLDINSIINKVLE